MSKSMARRSQSQTERVDSSAFSQWASAHRWKLAAGCVGLVLAAVATASLIRTGSEPSDEFLEDEAASIGGMAGPGPAVNSCTEFGLAPAPGSEPWPAGDNAEPRRLDHDSTRAQPISNGPQSLANRPADSTIIQAGYSISGNVPRSAIQPAGYAAESHGAQLTGAIETLGHD